MTEASSPFELLDSIERRIREHAEPLPEEQLQANNRNGIAFRLKEWRLVATRGLVREVLVPSQITRVPGTHPWVAGVANVHGSALPVVDLVDFFWGERLSASPANRILLVCQGELECGMLVNEVMGVHPLLSQEECSEPRPFPVELSDYLVGWRCYQSEIWGEFSMQALVESPGFIDLSL